MPEYRNQGIATLLLNEAVCRLRNRSIKRLEAWTRDDKWVNDWYKRRGFKWKESYLHVYTEENECDDITESKVEKLFICNCFAHYIGDNKREIKEKFKRVHECNLYELTLLD